MPRTSTRAPWSSTVTTAAAGDPVGSAAADSADSDTTGTNDSVSAEAGSTNWPKRARRRQSCTCWGRQPWRRATSVTTAPGSRLSAAICAFKSSGHRLRPAPAYTSIRGDNGRLMSSEWSSIVSTLAEDDSSNGALKTPHKKSHGPRRYAYVRFVRGSIPVVDESTNRDLHAHRVCRAEPRTGHLLDRVLETAEQQQGAARKARGNPAFEIAEAIVVGYPIADPTVMYHHIRDVCGSSP